MGYTLELLINKLTEKCLQGGILQEKDAAWFRYGVEKRLSTLITFVPFCILAVLLADLAAALSFFASFFYMRQRANGYHSQTVLGCTITSLFWELLFLDCLFPVLNTKLCVLINLICTVLVFALAPYDHPKMHFSCKELQACRSSAITRSIIIFIIAICSCSLGASTIARGITTGNAMAAFSLCLAYIIKWRNPQWINWKK